MCIYYCHLTRLEAASKACVYGHDISITTSSKRRLHQWDIIPSLVLLYILGDGHGINRVCLNNCPRSLQSMVSGVRMFGANSEITQFILPLSLFLIRPSSLLYFLLPSLTICSFPPASSLLLSSALVHIIWVITLVLATTTIFLIGCFFVARHKYLKNK